MQGLSMGQRLGPRVRGDERVEKFVHTSISSHAPSPARHRSVPAASRALPATISSRTLLPISTATLCYGEARWRARRKGRSMDVMILALGALVAFILYMSFWKIGPTEIGL